jgi:hypothetical protein
MTWYIYMPKSRQVSAEKGAFELESHLSSVQTLLLEFGLWTAEVGDKIQ